MKIYVDYPIDDSLFLSLSIYKIHIFPNFFQKFNLFLYNFRKKGREKKCKKPCKSS